MKKYKMLGVLLLAIFFVGCNGAMGNKNDEAEAKEKEYQEKTDIIQNGNVTDKPAVANLANKRFKSSSIVINKEDKKLIMKFNQDKSSCTFREDATTSIVCAYPVAEYKIEGKTITFNFIKYAKAMSTYTIEDLEKWYRAVGRENITGMSPEEIIDLAKKENVFEKLNKFYADYVAGYENGTYKDVVGTVSADYNTITINELKLPYSTEMYEADKVAFEYLDSKDLEEE